MKQRVSTMMYLKSWEELSMVRSKMLQLTAQIISLKPQLITSESQVLRKIMVCWEICSTRKWRKIVIFCCRCPEWKRKIKFWGSREVLMKLGSSKLKTKDWKELFQRHLNFLNKFGLSSNNWNARTKDYVKTQWNCYAKQSGCSDTTINMHILS